MDRSRLKIKGYVCDKCGKETKYFFLTASRQVCYSCYLLDKEKTITEPEMQALGDLGKP